MLENPNNNEMMLENLIIKIMIGGSAMKDCFNDLIKNPLAARGAIEKLHEAMETQKKMNPTQAKKIELFIDQLKKRLDSIEK
jgi:hypothetical protein